MEQFEKPHKKYFSICSYYLVKSIAQRRVIRLSIRGLTTSDGSVGNPKNPRVACQIQRKRLINKNKQKIQIYSHIITINTKVHLHHMVSSFNC